VNEAFEKQERDEWSRERERERERDCGTI